MLSKPVQKLLVSALALFMVALCACDAEAPAVAPEKIRVTVLPDQQQQQLQGMYLPLFDYLQQQLQIEVEYVPSRSYQQTIKLFRERQVDLAFMGAASYIQASLEAQAIPLVMRVEDSAFTSYAISNHSIRAKTLKDLREKRFSFGSTLSTSGHLMPRYFFNQADILPESYFSTVHYAQRHDQTAKLVEAGSFDAGVASARVIDRMIKDGSLDPNRIDIVWTSPPYADYVWVVQSTLTPAFRKKLERAFLRLRTSKHKNILNAMATQGFTLASELDFANVKTVYESYAEQSHE